MISSFNIAAAPHIHFGVGARKQLLDILRGYGRKVLLITGGRSFAQSPHCQQLWAELSESFDIRREAVCGEPSPDLIDGWVCAYRPFAPDVVVALGGGSAVDAAKAVAGLLPSGDSVMDYLEGVGAGKVFARETTPFVALPTTAGTGGETSKNAVLSVVGDNGFKKSFRDERLVARHIVLDAELTLSCPPSVTAACGMDALTQLLESYVSRKANPFTDALAWSGLEKVMSALLPACQDGSDLQARSAMLYASSLSGLTLANAGLGSVHGLASPLGAFYPLAHGVVCGTLLAEATRINVEALLARDPSSPALKKYAAVGRLIAPEMQLDDEDSRRLLLGTLEIWQEYLQMPKLSDSGVKAEQLDKIIAHASSGSMATNPVTLEREEVQELLRRRL